MRRRLGLLSHEKQGLSAARLKARVPFTPAKRPGKAREAIKAVQSAQRDVKPEGMARLKAAQESHCLAVESLTFS